MVQQELLWPHYLAWLGAAVPLAATVVMWLWGVSQVLTVVSLGACGLGACAFFIICDRQRVQRSEIEALRAEVAASRSQS